MRKQWKKFIDEKQGNWSYGIVPCLVNRLDVAMKDGDEEGIKEVLNDLELQGIVLGKDGNLYFMSDIILSGLF